MEKELVRKKIDKKLLKKQDVGELKENKIVLIDKNGNQYGILTICSGWNSGYVKYLVKDLLYKSCEHNEKDFFDRFSEHISNMIGILREVILDCFEKGYVKFEYYNCDIINVDNLF